MLLTSRIRPKARPANRRYTFKMRTVKRDIASALIFSKDEKLLQVKNAEPDHGVYADAWVIPGGGIEDGETAEQAVVREVMEEIGLDISSVPTKLVWTGTGQSTRKLKTTGEEILVDMSFKNFDVRLDQDAKDVELIPSDEHKEFLWVDLGDLKNLVLSQPSTECLTELGYL